MNCREAQIIYLKSSRCKEKNPSSSQAHEKAKPTNTPDYHPSVPEEQKTKPNPDAFFVAL